MNLPNKALVNNISQIILLSLSTKGNAKIRSDIETLFKERNNTRVLQLSLYIPLYSFLPDFITFTNKDTVILDSDLHLLFKH